MLAPDAGGHWSGMGAIARELADRGHHVIALGTETARPLMERVGVPVVTLAEDGAVWPWNRVLGKLFALTGNRPLMVTRSWFVWQNSIVLTALPDVIRQHRFDVIVTDHALMAAGTVAAEVGVPWVTVHTTVPLAHDPDVPPLYTPWGRSRSRWHRARTRVAHAGMRRYFRPVLRRINVRRADIELDALAHLDDTVSPHAEIGQLVSELDLGRQVPPSFHYVGSLSADSVDSTAAHDFPWERLDGRPLVYASFGTVADSQNLTVVRAVVDACDGLDAVAVVALGRTGDEAAALAGEIGPTPPNVIVVGFAPQVPLLARSALFVTHAGTNSVLEAISHGVPMIAIPSSGDTPAMAARLVAAGVGVHIPARRAHPDVLRARIVCGLADAPMRERAASLSALVRDAGGAHAAATIIEGVLERA